MPIVNTLSTHDEHLVHQGSLLTHEPGVAAYADHEIVVRDGQVRCVLIAPTGSVR